MAGVLPEMAKAAWISVELDWLGAGEVGEGVLPDVTGRALRWGDLGEAGPFPEEAEVTEVTIMWSGAAAPWVFSSSRSNLFSGTGGAGSYPPSELHPGL